MLNDGLVSREFTLARAMPIDPTSCSCAGRGSLRQLVTLFSLVVATRSGSLTRNMAARWIHVLAGISGASAVALGAYGAHGFPASTDAYFLEVFKRANHYHLIHSGLLAVAPLARRPTWVAGLAAVGTLLFSGSCYAIALTQNRAFAKAAPMGGLTLIAAWLALAL
ncbi:hypothetical protein V8C86DRAFT_1149486 [Haematococcus lacustris]